MDGEDDIGRELHEIRDDIALLRKEIRGRKPTTTASWLPAGLNFVIVLTGCMWVYTSISSMQTTLTLYAMRTGDRLTAAMFVEIQDKLAMKNPDIRWLDASEVREIQRHHPPYMP